MALEILLRMMIHFAMWRWIESDNPRVVSSSPTGHTPSSDSPHYGDTGAGFSASLLVKGESTTDPSNCPRAIPRHVVLGFMPPSSRTLMFSKVAQIDQKVSFYVEIERNKLVLQLLWL